MARTRSTRNHSPAAPLDPPPAPQTDPTDPQPASGETSPRGRPLPAAKAPAAPSPRRKRPVEPKPERVGARKKQRLAAVEVDGAGEEAVQRRGATSRGAVLRDSDGEAERMCRVGKKISLGDGQRDYTLTCPLPWRDAATREFHFDDFPEFRPNLSPEEIIRQGSFDGGFFRPVKSQKSGRELHEDWSDFPHEWYDGLDSSLYLTRPDPGDDSVNKWQARMGQPYEAWEKNGWLRPEHDARGWYQWYYRFFLGRRCDDDARQVQRWKGVAGDTGRFRRMLLGQYRKAGVNFVETDEEPCSPGIRQTLNHWAYDPTTAHLNRFREEKGDRVANDHADAS
ncbi:hypothetical protein JCM3770_004466 [Rhodotorula araucariae]